MDERSTKSDEPAHANQGTIYFQQATPFDILYSLVIILSAAWQPEYSIAPGIWLLYAWQYCTPFPAAYR